MSCENNSSIQCSCTHYSCGNHGKCCDCVANHRSSGEFPACFFSAEMEKTYNRSFEALVKDRN